MKTISKSVLQPADQVIQEDDKDEFFDILNQAADHIHWELESEAGIRYNNKNVLRYVPERKEWVVYDIDAETGERVQAPRGCQYYKKYENALRTFNSWCELDRTDPAKAKRIKPVFDTE